MFFRWMEVIRSATCSTSRSLPSTRKDLYWSACPPPPPPLLHTRLKEDLDFRLHRLQDKLSSQTLNHVAHRRHPWKRSSLVFILFRKFSRHLLFLFFFYTFSSPHLKLWAIFKLFCAKLEVPLTTFSAYMHTTRLETRIIRVKSWRVLKVSKGRLNELFMK